MKEKLYFASTDEEMCHQLDWYLDDLGEGEQITLIEAILDNNNPDYIWCGYVEAVGERNECKKSQCGVYHSKSGRGVCSHRGNLYEHGNEVTFKV